MLARFMSATPLSTIEIEMQLIPGFKPRGSGTFRNREIYASIPSIPYKELLRLFIKEIQLHTFAARIEKLFRESEANPMFFRNAEHRRRFQSVQKSGLFPLLSLSEAYATAVFLLTSDAFLWKQSKDCIDQSSIRFKDIRIHGVDLNGYAIFHTAKDLYQGTDHIALSELSDPELINDKLLRLIINAFLIRRHGITVIRS